MGEKNRDTLWSFVVMLLIGGPTALLRAHVIVALWGWFMLQLRFPVITELHALGIVLVVGALTGFSSKEEPFDSEYTETQKAFLRAIRSVAFSLGGWGVGAVLHWTMLPA